MTLAIFHSEPSVPPNSATKEDKGYISCSDSTMVFFEIATKEKVKWSDLKLVKYWATRLYFLYRHGFLQPLIWETSSKSDLSNVSNNLSYSLGGRARLSNIWKNLFTCIGFHSYKQQHVNRSRSPILSCNPPSCIQNIYNINCTTPVLKDSS